MKANSKILKKSLKTVKKIFRSTTGKCKTPQSKVKKLETEDEEINDPVRINKELNSVIQTLFNSSIKSSPFETNEMLKKSSLPLLNFQEKQDCENNINK